MNVRVLPCGERALLVEVGSLGEVLELEAALRAAAAPGRALARWQHVVADVVPAARTLLIRLTHPGLLGTVGRIVARVAAGVEAGAELPAPTEVVELEVTYDGADLDEVARLTGLSAREVAHAHAATPWRVAFGGFAPGFAYLVGGDPRLAVPRRREPRPAVPAGAVGLAGEFSGVYPRASPGGWQLIGRTDAVLWEPGRDPAALLRPGVGVRFVLRRGRGGHAGGGHGEETLAACDSNRPSSGEGQSDWPEAASPQIESHAAKVFPGRPAAGAVRAGASGGPARALHVLEAGPLTLVQDLGRAGHASVGVSPSGAADRGSLALANRLASNPPGAAALEITLGPFAVRARGAVPVAVTGAPALATVNGRPVPHAGPVYLADGDELRLSTPATGLRMYLAAAGGLVAPVVLGSSATDTLAGLGPQPVRAGDVLVLGDLPALVAGIDAAPVTSPLDGVVDLDVLPGPRVDWLADRGALAGAPWRVASASDRVGVRLEGPALGRAPAHGEGELPSEGVVRGAVQLPPNGRPVVFGADHPVTGGYPVVGVLTEAAADLLAQVRPGQEVRFRWVRG